ncbi:Hypothetical protein CAP_5421 [Chondromyces apiculatus DSM 436]|uniref:Uncharacterized protein n=2 Tax=Chondromyces apiculatus TaxID=51 RepID=A0A017T496_9BACT|nr:Hypothetical protein CAP_5421 [Chondromyces apiculatus DSM 436]
MADVVGPPPDTCPDGSTPQTCHGGPYCAPRTCASENDCDAGELCVDRKLCLGELGCGGLLEPDAMPPMTPTITGTCEGTTACTAPATCTTMKVCAVNEGGVTQSSTTSSGGSSGNGGSDGGSGDSGGCSFGAAQTRGGLVAALGVLAAGAALLTARRQRPSQRRR